MSPSEIQELLDYEPFVPLRLTLASGNVVELRHREDLSILDLSIAIRDTSFEGTPRLRLVSIPNICLVEPMNAQRDPEERRKGVP